MSDSSYKLGVLFIILIFLGFVTSLVATNITVEENDITSTSADQELRILWMESTINGETYNFQLGIVILGIVIFITIYAAIIYTRSEVIE